MVAKKRKLKKDQIEITKISNVVVHEPRWRAWREEQGHSMAGVVSGADVAMYISGIVREHFAEIGFPQD